MDLLVLPIAVPLLTAVACLLARPSIRLQEGLSAAGALLLLGASALLVENVLATGVRATQVGHWPAPFGITLVADMFSALMVAITGVLGASVVFYSRTQMDARRRAFGFHPLVHVLLSGVCGAFLTGDIFNLYVWFEVMLISSFALMALGGERAQLEGAIKYVVLNLLSSALFLAGVGILYGMSGTLNMAHLSIRLSAQPATAMVDATALLFLVAFGIKAAVFPLFFWLPASYPAPPAAVTALFAGLLTKVGLYALIRVFTLVFVRQHLSDLVLAIAPLTMLTGVLGAVAQSEMRRLLSFHIVSQIGYMLVGLGLFERFALAGSIFFILHNILAKSNLFLVSGMVERVRGTTELRSLGELARRRPLLAFSFLVPALSLAGMPPSSGFFAKLFVVRATFARGEWLVGASALVVSLLTLFSMMKIWRQAFWRPRPESEPVLAERKLAWSMVAPSLVLSALSLALGLFPAVLFGWSNEAARQLLERSEYVRAVLGG